MLVVRPITSNDYAELYHCAVESGYGFTSLPINEQLLRQRIERSVASFDKSDVTKPSDESYLMVGVDDQTCFKEFRATIAEGTFDAHRGYLFLTQPVADALLVGNGDKVEVILSDQMVRLLGGFYEFDKRYPMANGKLYSVFVEASADKIFESTNQ